MRASAHCSSRRSGRASSFPVERRRSEVMSSYRPINAVVRAIDLLFVLNRQPLCTVDHLHKHTRIPKPTIVRLLETLAHRGLVQRGSRHGSYQVTAAVNSLSSGYHSEAKIVEAAGPIAVRLTKEI